tara:strand:+ start:374 stop:676 length:303 start_codon:yes stop_codon:yes gene_type:complete
MVRYEWDLETVDSKHGDVLDHHHADKLKELLFFKNKKPSDFNPNDKGTHYDLVLVRDLWVDSELEQRTWAYEDEGKIPKEFDNGISVPKRFLAEYERVWK